MPLFEYQCQDCGHQFEALVFGSRRPEVCPRCDSRDIEKQFSTFGTGPGSGRAAGGSSPRPACGSSGGG